MCENLESLDDSSLRKKCIQYGLPNVPVTDSSRKVLIRRLRMTINNSNVNASNKIPENSLPSTTVKSTLLFDSKTTGKTNSVEKIKSTELQPPKRLRAANKTSCNKRYEDEDPVLSKNIVDASMSENRSKCRLFGNYNDPCGRNELTNKTEVKNTELHSSYPINFKNQIAEPSDKSYNSNNLLSDHIYKGTVPQARNRNNSYKDRDHNEGRLINAPYLSDFTRSLERLKNDSRGRLHLSSPISMPGHEKTFNETSRFHQRFRNPCNVDETFKDFLIALERKYHLKRNSIIIFSALLVVFIFVFFVM